VGDCGCRRCNLAWRAYERCVIPCLGNYSQRLVEEEDVKNMCVLANGGAYSDGIIGGQIWRPRTLIILVPISVSIKEIGIVHRSPHIEGWRGDCRRMSDPDRKELKRAELGKGKREPQVRDVSRRLVVLRKKDTSGKASGARFDKEILDTISCVRKTLAL